MIEWEYTEFYLRDAYDNFSIEAFIKNLNEYGESGWELVCIVDDNIAILKRKALFYNRQVLD